MNKKLKNYLLGPAFESFLSSFSAILIGLLFGFLILLISHPSQALPLSNNAIFTDTEGNPGSASAHGH